MSTYMQPEDRMDVAWARALRQVNSQKGGHLSDLILTVLNPTLSDADDARSAVDMRLSAVDEGSVATVANTLFPASLYNPPAFSWSNSLTANKVAELDRAATDLYEAYNDALPILRTFDANKYGTYFARLMTWPGLEAGGLNQLATRIEYLRGKKNHHASDIVVAGEAEISFDDNFGFGLQEYASGNRRQRGFPCLSYVSLSAFEGRLSMTAVYRNWHMVTRAYGNLIGLARILSFLAQQSGLEVGELIIHAGHATAERSSYGGIPAINALADEVESAAIEVQSAEAA